jgi:hypothetical protein
MVIKSGQFKTKRLEGSRSCMFCNKDVTEWQAITFADIDKLYEASNVKPPAALCCLECFKKPSEQLNSIFWVTVIMVELTRYFQGDKKGLIRTETDYHSWLQLARDKSVIQAAQEHLKDIRSR